MDYMPRLIPAVCALAGVGLGFLLGTLVRIPPAGIPIAQASAPEYTYEVIERPLATLPSDLDNWITQKAKAYREEPICIQQLSDRYIILMRGRK